MGERVTTSHLKDLIRELKNQNIDLFEGYVSISFDHHEIHEENSYYASASVASDSSISISFKTGVGKRLHILVAYASEAASHIEYKEGVTITATTGTEKDLRNRDRNSSNESTVLQNKSGSFLADNNFLVGATTTGGTAIVTHVNWADKKFGTERRGIAEWILEEDTEYEFLLTSDAGDQGLHIDLNWYEVNV